jgi:hypothetical protein
MLLSITKRYHSTLKLPCAIYPKTPEFVMAYASAGSSILTRKCVRSFIMAAVVEMQTTSKQNKSA